MKKHLKPKKKLIIIFLIIAAALVCIIVFFYPKDCGSYVVMETFQPRFSGYRKCKCLGFKVTKRGTHEGKYICFGIPHSFEEGIVQ